MRTAIESIARWDLFLGLSKGDRSLLIRSLLGLFLFWVLGIAGLAWIGLASMDPGRYPL